MEIKDLVRLLRQNILYLILGLVLGAGVGMAVSKIQVPVYEATAKVFVSKPSQQGQSSVLLLDDEQLLAINLQLAKFQSFPDDISSQVDGQISRKKIQITEVPNSQILSIKVQDGDPQRAAAIANLVVQALIKQNETLLSERYTEYENSVNQQMDQVQQQISSLQAEIGQTRDIDVQGQLAQVNQQIEQLQTEITALEQEIAVFPFSPSPRQRGEIAEREGRLEQLLSLMAIYRQIETNLNYVGNPVENGSGVQNPQLTTLQSTLDLYQQIKVNLIDSREGARLAAAQSKQNVMQIVDAVPSNDPVLPMPTIYVLLGGLVGLVLAVVAVLMVDHMDESLKSAAQVEELLGLPVLGFVSSNKHKNGLVTSLEPYSAEADAFRALGASLEVSGAGKNISSLMIVNAEPKDARTNIAANLAVINAQQGKRVILLDGDLKHPHLHSLFGMENQKGFSELLNGRVDIKNARHVVKDVEGLTLISSGVAEKGSTAWLDPEKWGQLLSELQEQADLVIVDSPPADVADAQILASKINAVLLAVRSGHTRIDAAQATLRRFQLIGIGSTRVAGAVLTDRTKYHLIFPLAKIKSHKKEEAPGIHSETDEAPISLS